MIYATFDLLSGHKSPHTVNNSRYKSSCTAQSTIAAVRIEVSGGDGVGVSSNELIQLTIGGSANLKKKLYKSMACLIICNQLTKKETQRQRNPSSIPVHKQHRRRILPAIYDWQFGNKSITCPSCKWNGKLFPTFHQIDFWRLSIIATSLPNVIYQGKGQVG